MDVKRVSDAATGLSNVSCAWGAAFVLADAQLVPGAVSGLVDVKRAPDAATGLSNMSCARGTACAFADAQFALDAVSGLVDVKCASGAWLMAETGFGLGDGVYASGAEVAARVGRRASGMGWPPTKQISAPSSSS